MLSLQGSDIELVVSSSLHSAQDELYIRDGISSRDFLHGDGDRSSALLVRSEVVLKLGHVTVPGIISGNLQWPVYLSSSLVDR
jgi:hypothetical protein